MNMFVKPRSLADREAMRKKIEDALSAERNTERAAERLGVSRRTLCRRVADLGIAK
jgi:transcriptional regulator with PAS, ATPase and Fis domain